MTYRSVGACWLSPILSIKPSETLKHSQIHVKPHQKPVNKCSDFWQHLSNLSKWQVTITTLSQQLKQWTDNILSKSQRTLWRSRTSCPSWQSKVWRSAWSSTFVSEHHSVVREVNCTSIWAKAHIYPADGRNQPLLQNCGGWPTGESNFPDETDQKQLLQSSFWGSLSKRGIRHPILLGCWLLVENDAWTFWHFTQPEE